MKISFGSLNATGEVLDLSDFDFAVNDSVGTDGMQLYFVYCPEV